MRAHLAASLAACLSFGSTANADCTFERGDANLDATVNIADALRILGVLFLGDPRPDCEDVMDANDVGAIDISDPVYLLGFLFNGSAAPPSPFRDCGPDPTADGLGCNLYHACAGCVSEADFQGAIAAVASADLCMPAGTNPGAQIEPVPFERAVPCGEPPSPGWPIQLTAVQGTLDLPARKARFHVEGSADGMPVDLNLPPLSANCNVDIQFAADAEVGFQVVQAGAGLVVTALDSVSFQNEAVDVSISGGFACSLAGPLVAFFENLIVEQIELTIADQLPALSEQLGCRLICPEG